jgi:hypothetical protein
MIRKSGIRFSERIMLKQKARAGCRSNHNSSRSSSIKSGTLPCGAELADLIECCLVSITLNGFNVSVPDKAD